MRSSIIFRIVLTFHSRSRAPARGSGSGRKTETFTDIVDESVHPGKGFLSPRSSARELVDGRTLQFTVSLQFANSNADNRLAPSVLHDGNGCRPGKNVGVVQKGPFEGNSSGRLSFSGDGWVR